MKVIKTFYQNNVVITINRKNRVMTFSGKLSDIDNLLTIMLNKNKEVK